MRVFDDEEGRRWQAATVFGSYGETRLIFSRMDAEELRTATMSEANLREAEQALNSLDENELRARLGKAEAHT